MRVEILFPPEGTFCLFEPAFNVPYHLVHVVEAPAPTLEEALDRTWRYANIVHPGDPWIKTGLRSAMIGDVFLVKGEAHAGMMMGLAIRVPARGGRADPPRATNHAADHFSR